MKHLIIALLGPTAVGKTHFAFSLAQELGGEIVCVDSTTLYKGMDIGSAKPEKKLRKEVPHHLLDIAEPNEPFNLFHYLKEASRCLEDILKRNKVPIVVGGSYFYFRGLEKGICPTGAISSETEKRVRDRFWDEKRGWDTPAMWHEIYRMRKDIAEKIHPNDAFRVRRFLSLCWEYGEALSLNPTPLLEYLNPFWLKYALIESRHVLLQRIVERVHEMVAQGLVEEAVTLWRKYGEVLPLRSIGYREALDRFQGKIGDKEMINRIVERTRRLVKKQFVWLRADTSLHFIDRFDRDRCLLEFNNLKFSLEKRV